MSRHHNSTLLSQGLGLVMVVSLLGAVVMGLLALVMWSLGQTRCQILLTLVCLLVGSLLMQIQLRARRNCEGGTSILLSTAVAVVVASQVCFLILVWTDWQADSFIWRVWWLTMVPSVFVTYVILLHWGAARRGGLAEAITGVFAVWAGLMIVYLGLRRDMLSGISPTFFQVGVVPVAGTVLGTLYVLVGRFIWTNRSSAGAQRVTVGGLVTSLVVALAAFYVGRVTAPQAPAPAEPDQQPPTMAVPAGDEVGWLPRPDPKHILATTIPVGPVAWRGGTSPASRPHAVPKPAPKPAPRTTAPAVGEPESPGGQLK
jgi:hypothetical protein